MIGLTVILVAACEPQTPASDFRQPLSSTGSATASGDTTDQLNETMPKTTDSLEVDVMPVEPTEMRAGSGSVVMGSANAAMTLVIYEDYDCFYCREFGSTHVPWLLTTYVAQKKLQIERVFVADSPAGILMAKAALCSEKQGLFATTDAALLARPISTDAQIAALAKSVQLNLKQLQTCMASAAVAASLETSVARAKAAEVIRFPAFELGTDRWIGVLTREDLQKRIEKAL